ncbi:MAG: esterase family protein [Chitinophagaceae bacterium]|nr:esterase family protein [Chitinophagaceae bacterium]
MKKIILLLVICSPFILSTGCKKKTKQSEDSIYSRHLQRHVDLTILTTPLPEDKNALNLLLLNDGQELAQLRVKEIVDSLYAKKLIQPLVVVAIKVDDRMQEYGVADLPDYEGRGSSAAKYAAFIDDELYPFIKKKTGVRKFNSITLQGCSLGALSAFDIAWDHADKIDKVGVFSGSFWWRDKTDTAPGYTDDKDRIMLNKIRSSRKKPHLKYWFYAGGNEEKGDRDKDGIIDVIDDTKDLLAIIKSKNVCPPEDIVYTELKEGTHDYTYWSQVFPSFLIWAVGK